MLEKKSQKPHHTELHSVSGMAPPARSDLLPVHYVLLENAELVADAVTVAGQPFQVLPVQLNSAATKESTKNVEEKNA